MGSNVKTYRENLQKYQDLNKYGGDRNIRPVTKHGSIMTKTSMDIGFPTSARTTTN
jgi:hypothetical protein